jgi:diguanylate cyclase (GGDEF)-like protein
MHRAAKGAPDQAGVPDRDSVVPATEWRQARLRLLLSLLACGLAMGAAVSGHPPALPAVALAYLAASALLLLACKGPVTAPAWRRYPAILVDVGAATGFALLVDSAVVTLYPLFLAIAADHGLRFRRPYVTLASWLTLAGYASVALGHGLEPGSVWIPAALGAGLLLLPHHLVGLTDEAAADSAGLLAQRDAAEFRASHDQLTGLPNRAALQLHLRQGLARARRAGGELTLLLLDIDGFRAFTEACGRDAGDRLLLRAAEAMRSVVRDSDSVARIGGDQFAVVVEGTERGPGIETLIDRLFSCFGNLPGDAAQAVELGCGCGIAIYPRDGGDSDALLRNAGVALRAAKARGRNRFAFFDARLAAQVASQARLREAMQHAVAGQQLGLVFQPLVDERTGRVSAAEALLRWRHPRSGTLPARRFIGVAERSGLVVPLGDWAIRQALQVAAAWHSKGCTGLSIHANVAGRQLRRDGFADEVGEWLAASGVAPAMLVLEVGEGALCAQQSQLSGVLRQLRAFGVRIALDNFGTASSSLAMLRDLPVDIIKIDRALSARLPDSARDCALVDSLLTLGDRLGHDVVACGVETEAQREWLAIHGCRFLQGHWFGQPLAPAEFFDRCGETVAAAPALARVAQWEISAGGR